MNRLESDSDSNDDIRHGEDVELGTTSYQHVPEDDFDEELHDQNNPNPDDDGRIRKNNWYGLCVSYVLILNQWKHFEPALSIYIFFN